MARSFTLRMPSTDRDEEREMNRRKWISSTACAAIFGATRRTLNHVPLEEIGVSSDIAPLQSVLVHEPGPETRKVVNLLSQEHPFDAVDFIGPEATEQHRQFVKLLESHGVQVLRFADLLNEALAAARAADELLPWLTQCFPKLADQPDAVTAEALIGADSRFVFPPTRPAEPLIPLVNPLKFLLYTRDLATMTPKGLVVANLAMPSRNPELSLFRLMLTWAPRLAACPLVFDAGAEEVQFQGGDLIQADPTTLLLGVGNLTDERAAMLLAAQLDMDVIAVTLPGPGTGRNRRNSNRQIRSAFLHLDTICSLVDRRTVLAVPYFLESAQSGRDPFSSLVKGLVRDGTLDPAAGAETLNQVKQIGIIRRYLAGTGELDPTLKEKKLLDYLKARDFKVVYVGGGTQDRDPAQHLMEQVLPELRFQAANVVAVKPGVVLAVESNKHTNEALKAAGVKVQTFPASELVRWHGGAHCMTLPLRRSDG